MFSYAIHFMFPSKFSLFLWFRKGILQVFLKFPGVQIPSPLSPLAINILKMPVILFSTYRSHSHHALEAILISFSTNGFQILIQKISIVMKH